MPVNIQLSKNVPEKEVRSQETEVRIRPRLLTYDLFYRATLNSGIRNSDFCLLLLVGLGRVELPTSPLSGVRSSHLSYRPMGFGELVELVGIEPATS
jgi:hypothetical protein